MATLLVTVVGPERRRDLSLPADAPLVELLPTLVRLVADGADGEIDDWVLSPPAEAPLPIDATLADSGVLEGAVLHLRRVEEERPSSVPPPVPAVEGSPLERTAAALPPRRGGASRFREAAGAFFRAPTPRLSREPAPEPGPDGRPALSPAVLTTAPRPSPVQRARETWRASDYLEQLDRAILAPKLRRCVTIAVVSPKGGVGKTTITALLGTLFALLRRDRIVAVDTNPDYGSLGRVLAPDHRLYVDDLLERVEEPNMTATTLDTLLGRGPHGLRVLPAPTDPARMWRLDEAAYTRVIERLQELVNMVVLDCGTGLQEPAAGAAIKAAQQLILVSDAEPAGASLVAEAGHLLARAGRPIMLVVNRMPRTGSSLDLQEFGRWLPQASGLVVIPADVRAAGELSSGRFDWASAPEPWRRSVRELAAALMAEWPALGLTV